MSLANSDTLAHKIIQPQQLETRKPPVRVTKFLANILEQKEIVKEINRPYFVNFKCENKK